MQEHQAESSFARSDEHGPWALCGVALMPGSCLRLPACGTLPQPAAQIAQPLTAGVQGLCCTWMPRLSGKFLPHIAPSRRGSNLDGGVKSGRTKGLAPFHSAQHMYVCMCIGASSVRSQRKAKGMTSEGPPSNETETASGQSPSCAPAGKGSGHCSALSLASTWATTVVLEPRELIELEKRDRVYEL